MLPFDVVGLIFTSPAIVFMHALRTLRLLRLLKLLRIIRATRIFARWETHVSISYGQLALVKFLVLILVMSHWVACGWKITGDYAIEYVESPTGVPRSWYTEYPYIVDYDHSIGTYVTALYWAIMTLTTIGYGDVVRAARRGATRRGATRRAQPCARVPDAHVCRGTNCGERLHDARRGDVRLHSRVHLLDYREHGPGHVTVPQQHGPAQPVHAREPPPREHGRATAAVFHELQGALPAAVLRAAAGADGAVSAGEGARAGRCGACRVCARSAHGAPRRSGRCRAT